MASITSQSGISTALGSYSGITAAEIDKLMEAESLPLNKLNKQKSKYIEQQSAWKDIKTRVNTLFNKIDSLQKNETFNTKVVTSSDASKVTISGKPESTSENYQISVQRLATATKITSGKIASLAGKDIYKSLSIQGNLTLTNDKGEASEVTVKADDSLKDIVNSINGLTKQSGIKAAIVDNQLVLSDVATGKKNLSVGGSLVDELGFGEGSSKFTQGETALFTIDGMEVERSSNTVTDVVEHLTINLHGKVADPVSLSVKVDVDKTVQAVKDLVEQYNSVMSFISSKLDVGDPSKKDNKSGSLVGDGSLTRLQSSLRILMTGVPGENSGTALVKPAEIGITSKDKTSTVVFDEAVFKKALTEDPESVQKFFFNQVTQEKTGVDTEGNPSVVKDTVDKGYTAKLKDLVNTFLNDDKGKKSVLTIRNESIEQSLKNLDTRITRFEDVLEKKRANYVKIYTRLDQVMMKAESQMSYLQSQMDSFSAR